MVVTVGLEPTVRMLNQRDSTLWRSLVSHEKAADEISATGGPLRLSPNRCVHISDDHWFEIKCDTYKNQNHRKGDPDFCVVTVGLEPCSAT